MKNLFLIITMVMSFNLLANNPVSAQTPGGAQAGSCEDIKTLEVKASANPKMAAKGISGSDSFSKCYELSRGQIEKLYSNGQRKIKLNWKEYAKYYCKDQCGKDGYAGCIKEAETLAVSCESVTFVMSLYDRDWQNSENYKAVTSTSKANAAQQVGNGQVTAAQAAAMASSIKCLSQGMETVDYDNCKRFTDQLEVIEAVQTVSYGVQETVYRSKTADASIKYASEENTATGALKATADSLKDQQDMYQQRSAVDATKLAYLYSIYNEIPTNAEVQDKCQGIERASNANEGPGVTVTADLCRNAVMSGKGGFAMNQNGPMREQMRTKLIAIATSLGSNTLLANLMGKRADDAVNAIAKIDAFTPTDPTTTTEDSTTTKCTANPSSAECLTSGLDSTLGTISDNVITFGDGGTGTTYGTSSSISSTAGTDTSTSSGSTGASDSMGSAIVAAAQDNSIEGSSGAKVTSAGAGGSSGGGGGGGASAGSGSGALPTAPQAGGVSAAVATGKAPAYSGGDGVSVVGGMGINRAKSGDGKTEDNPFGKLFGKDGKPGSGVLNFRDIASAKVGDKKDNLFEMISKRYTTVTADKRLLEYELAK